MIRCMICKALGNIAGSARIDRPAAAIVFISIKDKTERRMNENGKPALPRLRRKTCTAENMTVSGAELQGLRQTISAGSIYSGHG